MYRDDKVAEANTRGRRLRCHLSTVLTSFTERVWCSEDKGSQKCQENAVEQQSNEGNNSCHLPLPNEQRGHQWVFQQLDVLTLTLRNSIAIEIIIQITA